MKMVETEQKTKWWKSGVVGTGLGGRGELPDDLLTTLNKISETGRRVLGGVSYKECT